MIYGKKTVLVPLEQGHLQIIASWRNEKGVRDNFFSPWPIALSEQGSWYERYREVGRERVFLILTEDPGKPKPDGKPNQAAMKPVGMLSLESINLMMQSGEIGKVYSPPDARGKGYMKDALQSLIKFAFEEVNLHRLMVTVLKENDQAMGLYKSLGFQLEGISREAVFKNGKRKDVAMLSLLRTEA